ncbi:hypothetical protein VNI00_016988 [Paramarasmius palmivorus]|uniref:Uncharacterized protein n=1 Tax=Paramarasmius palmivorus TaxID=297713 RepID=A0AAW0BA69_9AGAR
MQADYLQIVQQLNTLSTPQKQAICVVVETLLGSGFHLVDTPITSLLIASSGATVNLVAEILDQTTFMNDLSYQNDSKESNTSQDGKSNDSNICTSNNCDSDQEDSSSSDITDTDESGINMDISDGSENESNSKEKEYMGVPA